MLREHLSEKHDVASRRSASIDRSISWILDIADLASGARILDLGCGPGLYVNRYAELGYATTGIDFSPVSIHHAQSEAERLGLSSAYRHDDLRTATFGDNFQLITFLYGEFNVFTKADASRILIQAHKSLSPDGMLIVEPSAYESFNQTPHGTSWYTSEQGIMSDTPHTCLSEFWWGAETQTETTRHYVIDAESGYPSVMAATSQAYSDAAYVQMFKECGFTDVVIHPNLTGDPERADYLAIVAKP